MGIRQGILTPQSIVVTPMRTKYTAIGMVVALLAAGSAAVLVTQDCERPEHDPLIADMVQRIDGDGIYSTICDLQNFTSRYYGYQGNELASEYLFGRMSGIPGLQVEYQGGEHRNVIATLPGVDRTSTKLLIMGAHYDSKSSDDLGFAPGATDNGGGVAIVLELARVLSRYSFDHTLVFALWNAEEGGMDMMGSSVYAKEAKEKGLDIAMYLNFDSACYDLGGSMVLDIMFKESTRCVASLMADSNRLYDIGLKLTYNVHTCGSDHRAFWAEGYPAIMTHQPDHGPAHTASDTADQVSTLFAKRNGQLGMAALAHLAGVRAPVDR